MQRALKTVSWKSVLLVILLAFGLRWALSDRGALRETPPPSLTQVGEPEEDGPPPEAAPGSSTAPASCEPTQASNVGPLAFDQDPVEINPRPEEEQVETTFTFVNRSANPVTVTNLESTCSCLEASLDKGTYAPGQKGTGRAVFKVSSFVGRHEKTLHLHMDDPATPEQVLTFILDVPVVVSIEPNLLEWTVGEVPAPKEMVFKMLSPDPLHITKVTPTRENVRYELKEITAGREYRLIVTPSTTENITVGAFKIETDSKIPKYARQMAFFNIVRPELAEKKKDAEGRRRGEGETGKP